LRMAARDVHRPPEGLEVPGEQTQQRRLADPRTAEHQGQARPLLQRTDQLAPKAFDRRRQLALLEGTGRLERVGAEPEERPEHGRASLARWMAERGRPRRTLHRTHDSPGRVGTVVRKPWPPAAGSAPKNALAVNRSSEGVAHPRWGNG